MSKIAIIDEHGNRQYITLPETFNVECDEHTTISPITKETFIRRVKDLISVTNTVKSKQVFPNMISEKIDK